MASKVRAVAWPPRAWVDGADRSPTSVVSAANDRPAGMRKHYNRLSLACGALIGRNQRPDHGALNDVGVWDSRRGVKGTLRTVGPRAVRALRRHSTRSEAAGCARGVCPRRALAQMARASLPPSAQCRRRTSSWRLPTACWYACAGAVGLP